MLPTAQHLNSTGEKEDMSDWLRTGRIEEHGYLVGCGEIRADDFQNLSNSDILNDINVCKDILERHGLEVLALDLTRPDIAFPTVRMIVPGLRQALSR